MVYEIARHRCRFLWIGENREESSLEGFFSWLGQRCAAIEHVCSEMWKPYLNVIARRIPQAVHVLDRFHWHYESAHWAGRFLDRWCTQAMRSRIEPMKAVAKTLRAHRPLTLDWFRVREEVSLGATEGMNNKLKVVTRRAYGFRSLHVVKIALYHTLGALPEPEDTHRFC